MYNNLDDAAEDDFSNFGSLKSTETLTSTGRVGHLTRNFSNFGSLKSTETPSQLPPPPAERGFSNFGSLKSTETNVLHDGNADIQLFQQFRLVEEH